MKKLFALIISVAMCMSILPSLVFAEPMESVSITEKPDYIGYLLENYDFMLLGKSSHRWKCNTAIRYYLYTHDKKYLNDAVKFFSQDCADMAADSKRLSDNGGDFFSANYLMQTYWELKKLGMVTPEQTEIIIKYMDSFFRPSLMDSHNQIIARAVGVAYAVQALPEAPKWQEWRDWLDKLWDYWYEDRDLQEDAGDYNAIMMRDIIRWAEVDGKSEFLKDDEIKKMFARFRDQLAPNGSMPEYGDDFYGRSADWIYIFEYCANFYDDPTFAYAARHIYDWAVKSGVKDCFIDTEMFDIPDLYDKAYLNEEAATISTRNYRNQKGATAKLMLRPSKVDGSPYILVDNPKYRISHSHPAAKGAIIYYEYDNIPLYHSLTRRFVDPRYQNVPFLMEDVGYYPFDTLPGNKQNPGRGRTNVWYHDELDITDLPTGDDGDPSVVDLDSIQLRLSKESDPVIWYYIDNIRLEGPAGTRMIYDFEDGGIGNFSRSDSPFENVAGGYESDRMMKITIDDTSVFYNATTNLKVNTNEYTHIKWDWKTESPQGNATTSLWSIVRAWDNNCPDDIVTLAVRSGYGQCYVEAAPGEMFNNNSYMTDEMVENSGKDTYSSFKLNDHIVKGTTVERRIVLTEEGYAIIQDTITPSEKADGFFGGPIFNLYNVKESGANWFVQKGEKKWYKNSEDTTGTRNGMFVMYSKKEGAQIGHLQSAEGADTTFLKTTMVKDTPITFITVLAPNLDDKKTGSDIAKSIVIQKDLTRDSSVSFKTDSGWVSVELPPDNSWKITRNNKQLQGIKVKLNSSYLSFNQPPVNVNGRILVPFRSVFEALGVNIDWDPQTQTVTGTREDKTISIKPDDTTAYIGGKPVKLDVPAKNINGKTMVPLRFISESFDATVSWFNDNQLVEIFAKIPESANSSANSQEPVILLSNGDMEGPSSVWTLQKSNGSFDKSVARSGAVSMKLESAPGSGLTWRGFRHEDISVEAGQTYIIKAWIKTQNLQPKSKVRISFGIKNGSGEWVVSDSDDSTKNLLQYSGSDATEWTEISAEYTIPEDGSKISYFTPRLDNNSAEADIQQAVWFDDITIEEAK